MEDFIKSVYSLFMSSDTFEKGAALAYYSVFSIIPILIVGISIFGIVLGEKAVEGDVFNSLKGVFGDKGATQIQTLILNQHHNHNSWLTSFIGFGILIFSASGMFNQLQSAFNDIWQIPANQVGGVWNTLTKHFTSFSILILLFFVIIASTGIHTFIVHHAKYISKSYAWVYWAEHIVSYVLIASCFLIMFRVLGDADHSWKACAIGGLLTAAFFMLGKVGLGYYLSSSTKISAFGSASVLALIMVWVYYMSQIIFLGAVIVKILHKT